MSIPWARLITGLGILAPIAPCQELLWQHSGNKFLVGGYSWVAREFGDINRDGIRDLLALFEDQSGASLYPYKLRTLSGWDGAVLSEHFVGGPVTPVSAGDFDGDGACDYAYGLPQAYVPLNDVVVYSPSRGIRLLTIQGVAAERFGEIVEVGDFTGDGLADVLVASPSTIGLAAVRMFDHFGVLQYTFPMGSAMVPYDLRAMPDIDGDGCAEFLIGGFEYSLGYARGCVLNVSGRTGAIRHFNLDQQQYDRIGYPLTVCGDVDGDSVPDYSTGNYYGLGRGLEILFSGLTGAPLRQWEVPVQQYAGESHAKLGQLDVDLDGYPELIRGLPAYPSPNGWRIGRVDVRSWRDGQELMHIDPQGDCDPGYFCNYPADLGHQPGSPYPVMALIRKRFQQEFTLEVWRLSPPGVTQSGSSCSTAPVAPTIGLRRVGTANGEQCRIVLGSAAPGALAWCVGSLASTSSFQGLALPISMDPLGFAGCQLQVAIDVSIGTLVGNARDDTGYAAIDLPWPMTGVGGLHLAAQWLVLDPATLGYSASRRMEFRIQ